MQTNIEEDVSEKFNLAIQRNQDESNHQLGKIKSNGLLFGFNLNLELIYFSSNLNSIIAPLRKKSQQITLSNFFNQSIINSFTSFTNSKMASEVHATLVDWQETPHQLRFSKSNLNEIIIELEVFNEKEQKSLITKLNSLDIFLKGINSFKNEKKMASNAVKHFKIITGFDRVMYYKFDDNGEGEVLAEEKSSNLESFLGLRYLAKDVPRQTHEEGKKKS
ncbi:hypothetical protein [Polaribacter sp. IC063]|uniref:hypothetical protein n=1 Tax=Polaribacter sp. IC063 TaxID=57031 RepID=UPI0011BDF678|nr:hypothetical protein [Polaribacter sp. IC063]TXD51165.1 hypothetical protein ES043_13300 [Polaribacter sp. IC063]